MEGFEPWEAAFLPGLAPSEEVFKRQIHSMQNIAGTAEINHRQTAVFTHWFYLPVLIEELDGFAAQLPRPNPLFKGRIV